MPRFFLIIILLFLISNSLFLIPAYAQENSPQGTNPWDNFKNNLIPETLKNVNCSGLPAEICSGISSADKSALKTQAAGNNANSEQTIGNAAGQYVVASGIHTPPEVANAQTNIILEFFSMIAQAIGNIFKRGETQAKNYARTGLPQEAAEASGINKPNTAMEQALPMVQCAELPAELCTNNKPNAL